MSAPGTPKASQAAITAVQEALGCRRGQFVLRPGEPWGCGTHAGYRDFEWTERGCPVAVAAADAAAPHNAADALLAFADEVVEMGRLTNYGRSEFLTSNQTDANMALLGAKAAYDLVVSKARGRAAE